ncbi:MAG: hypothetical protein CMD74_02540 [Gammaproteobacteria bacterium]|nr:hypothetical protein [Gammaproteobacteria bacterium]
MIARDAKKMQIDATVEMLKKLRDDHKQLVQNVKDEKESARNAKATAQAEPRVYKDNAVNRKLGRVGDPIPSRKKVKSASAAAAAAGGGGGGAASRGGASGGSAKKAPAQRFYKDNAYNQRLGRVGDPILPKKKKKAAAKAAPVVVEMVAVAAPESTIDVDNSSNIEEEEEF